MNNCIECAKVVSTQDHVLKSQCCDCLKFCHLKCAKLTESDIKLMKTNEHLWRCKKCDKVRRQSLRTEIETEKDVPTITDVYKLLQSLKEEVEKLKKVNIETERELGKSLESVHQKLDENTTLIKRQEEVINTCTMKIEKLTEENITLKKQLKSTQLELDEQQQYSRRNTVEVYGVPEEANENTLDVVKNVGRVLDIKITDDMVDNCHRLPRRPHQTTSGIIVKFVRCRDKELFLQRRKVKRNLNTTHLGYTSNETVYVNQSLTPYRKRIFNQARLLKQQKGYAYLWVDTSGNIKLRKAVDSNVVVLKEFDDVNALK